MIVLFDVSVLGVAEIRARASRTGVYTYVKNLALALNAQPGLRLKPICSDPRYLRESLAACRALGLDLEILQTQLWPGLPPWLPGLWAWTRALAQLPAPVRLMLQPLKLSLQLALLGPLWLLHGLLPLARAQARLAGIAGGQVVLHDPHWSSTWYGWLRRLGLITMPRCVTVHDMIPLLFPQWFGARLRRRFRRNLGALWSADLLIAVSATTAADVVRSWPVQPGQRVRVTPLAAAPTFVATQPSAGEQAAVLQRYGLEPGRYLLSVCTLEPRKNIGRLLEAYAAVIGALAGQAPIRLVLVGPMGWQMAQLTATLDRLALTAHTTVTGYVPDQDLPVLLSACRAFVYPSLYEGFGLPVAEAMACGAAVLTSARASMLELFADSALLCDPEDGADLARCLQRLLEDDGLIADLQARSRSRSRTLSWTATAQATAQAYACALEPGAQGAC